MPPPLTDTVICKHWAGDHAVGGNPLPEADTCHFLAVDFDEADWRDAARAFIQSSDERIALSLIFTLF